MILHQNDERSGAGRAAHKGEQHLVLAGMSEGEAGELPSASRSFWRRPISPHHARRLNSSQGAFLFLTRERATSKLGDYALLFAERAGRRGAPRATGAWGWHPCTVAPTKYTYLKSIRAACSLFARSPADTALLW